MLISDFPYVSEVVPTKSDETKDVKESEKDNEAGSAPAETKTEDVEREATPEVNIQIHDATKDMENENDNKTLEEDGTKSSEEVSREQSAEQLYNTDTDEGEVLDDTAANVTSNEGIVDGTDEAEDGELATEKVEGENLETEKLPDANGNVEKIVDGQEMDHTGDELDDTRAETDSLDHEMGNHMEEHAIETPSILSRIAKRGKSSSPKDRRRKSPGPGPRKRGGKKRGELELLYDVSGPPSKRSRTARSVFLQEVQEVIRPATSDVKATEKEETKPEVETSEAKPATTPAEPKSKIQTRGKKNRYWYTFAKQSKSNSPLYLSKPENADISEIDNYRKDMNSEKRSGSRPNTPSLDIYANVPGDESPAARRVSTETPPSEKRPRTVSPAPEKIDKTEKAAKPISAAISVPVSKTAVKITPPSPRQSVSPKESNSPKQSISPKPPMMFSGPAEEMLAYCQPCKVAIIDFIKCLDLFKVPPEPSISKTVLKKVSPVPEETKAKTPEKEEKKIRPSGETTR